MPRTVHRPQHDPAVQAYVDAAAPAARPLLQAVRAAIAATVPDAEECLKWDAPCYLLHGLLFTLHVHPAGHVDLTLSRGVELLAEFATPLPLLGAGQVTRRLRIADTELLGQEAVLALLAAAGSLNRSRPRTRAGEAMRRAGL